MKRRIRCHQRNDSRGLYNREGYRDETAYYALRNTMRKRTHKRRKRQFNTIDINANKPLREDERFCWEELANSIIIQAAEDWRIARRRLKKYPADDQTRAMIAETEGFFLSDWYACLTDYPGELLLERLRKEFA